MFSVEQCFQGVETIRWAATCQTQHISSWSWSCTQSYCLSISQETEDIPIGTFFASLPLSALPVAPFMQSLLLAAKKGATFGSSAKSLIIGIYHSQ